MIEFTDEALVKAIEKVERHNSKGIRIALLGGGWAGFKYDFDYAEQAKEQDVEQDFGKFKLWVCPESAGYLDGMVIGWERDGLNEGFHFWNPMESSSCGCGVSVGF